MPQEKDYYGEEVRFKRDVRIFVAAFFKHWGWFTSTTLACGIGGMIAAFFWSGVVPAWVFWAVGLSGFFVASLLAFRDRRRISELKDAALAQIAAEVASSGGVELTRRGQAPDDYFPAGPPQHGAIPGPKPLPQGDSGREERLERLEDALSRVSERRIELERQGPEEYEKWRGEHREDAWCAMDISAAKNAVEECLGRRQAAYFLSSSGHKGPQRSTYPNYDRVIMRLERYEAQMRKLRDSLQ